MLPDQVSNPGPLTYESGALPIALRSPAQQWLVTGLLYRKQCLLLGMFALLLHIIPGSKCLPPAKKVNF